MVTNFYLSHRRERNSRTAAAPLAVGKDLIKLMEIKPLISVSNHRSFISANVIRRARRMVFTSQMYSLNFVGMLIMILIMCANIIKNMEDTIIHEHKLRKRRRRGKSPWVAQWH